MKDIKTAEQLIYFMRRDIRLSRYDSKFLDNLEVFASEKNTVTSNQVNLFHRIVTKYERQFSKLDAHVSDLIKLPWVAKVVPSISAYTDAFISIENDQIIFKGPYNKSFINAVRNNPDNSFEWDKENRRYYAAYSTASLKDLFDAACQHYQTVNVCEITTSLLDELTPYELMKYWSPTLVRINGNLIVVAANQYVIDAIKEIELNTNLDTLSKLVRYGIVIDDSLILELATVETIEQVNFASSFNPVLELNTSEIMVPWLVDLGCDYVYLSASSQMAKFTQAKLFAALKDNNIPYYDLDASIKPPPKSSNYKFPVVIRFRTTVGQFNDPSKVAKVIQLVNSQPVDLKLKNNETM